MSSLLAVVSADVVVSRRYWSTGGHLHRGWSTGEGGSGEGGAREGGTREGSAREGDTGANKDSTARSHGGCVGEQWCSRVAGLLFQAIPQVVESCGSPM